MINKATGNKAGIKYTSRRKWDTKKRLLASVDKAKKIIGYETSTKFEDGLIKTVEWFKGNWGKIEVTARFGPGVSSAVRSFYIK